ncbi:putative membrane protein [Klebsiella phage vB_KpnS-VAC4]|uniref:Membrane protein n=1 Tax=Klebsiella phage vB_KpnS-VAC4 TaxID=2864362 RepID=A0AAE7XHQ3_9CAUD|nr:putative membrane protein [Klebsiella phage vB_KpnS-VAC4]
MKFIILMMLTVLCMSGPGGFIFAVMLLVVTGIIDVRHHHVMTDLRLNRLINDIKAACEGMEIKVVKK